jgi:hypothetical protein
LAKTQYRGGTPGHQKRENKRRFELHPEIEDEEIGRAQQATEKRADVLQTSLPIDFGQSTEASEILQRFSGPCRTSS